MNRTWQIVVVLSALSSVAASPIQGPALENVMREKLGRSQKILEAVVTSNWASLDVQTRALEQLTNDPRWMVLKSPEYSRHSGEFVRAVRDLRQAAAQHDLDKTPQAYSEVILKCVDCHRYLTRTRLAK